MQVNHVKEVYPRIERYVDQAALLCQTTSDVPDELRDCLGELDRESDATLRALTEDTPNDNKIIACVDRLEKIGDRALQACRKAGRIDGGVQQAVQQAHDAIAELKRRLH